MKKILLFFAAAICAVASWAQATVSATVNGEELTVALSEDGQKFVAFQMDIQLPAGVTVNSTGAITVMTDRLTQPGTASTIDASENVNFKVLYNVLPDNRLRVIAYNLENREIGGNEGDALFTVALNGTSEDVITINNIRFVTKTQLEEATLAAVEAEAAGELDFDFNGSGDFDLADVSDLLSLFLSDGAYVLSKVDYDQDGAFGLSDVSTLLNLYLSK